MILILKKKRYKIENAYINITIYKQILKKLIYWRANNRG